MVNFIDVSELAGDEVSAEQVDRLCHRYFWAARYCAGKDVAEAACGSGAGLGMLSSTAKSFRAGDISDPILERVRAHYGDRIALSHFDAENLPFDDSSLDVIVLFEALYFVPDAARFAAESRRVLRPGGVVLMAVPNPDLYDFNPAPHSTTYPNPPGLAALFTPHGFEVRCFGYLPIDAVSLRQRVLRPVKKLAVSLNLMPKTMAGKALLKRLVFGDLKPLPAEITPDMMSYLPPSDISADQPDHRHKVLYCAATLF